MYLLLKNLKKCGFNPDLNIEKKNTESFNVKVKPFSTNLRGVTDTPFFLFRLMKLFA